MRVAARWIADVCTPTANRILDPLLRRVLQPPVVLNRRILRVPQHEVEETNGCQVAWEQGQALRCAHGSHHVRPTQSRVPSAITTRGGMITVWPFDGHHRGHEKEHERESMPQLEELTQQF